jgi:hypothetical protein
MGGMQGGRILTVRGLLRKKIVRTAMKREKINEVSDIKQEGGTIAREYSKKHTARGICRS